MKLMTHNGYFHVDDVLSTVILKDIYPGAEVIRTRDLNKMKEADIIYDIGFSYNPDKFIFDHHQKDKPLRQNGMPYSSVGLIWKHFGIKYLFKKGVTPDYINSLWKAIDDDLIYAVDLADNGVEKSEGHNLGHIINIMNQSWDENKDENTFFFDSVDFFNKYFSRYVDSTFSILKARKEIVNILNNRDNLEYAIFDKALPWKDIIFKEKNNIKNFDDLLYMIEPYGDSGNWVSYAVPVEEYSYETRMRFPEEWGGKSEKELYEFTNVDDANFCHSAGFILGAKSCKGVINMVEKSIEQNQKNKMTL